MDHPRKDNPHSFPPSSSPAHSSSPPARAPVPPVKGLGAKPATPPKPDFKLVPIQKPARAGEPVAMIPRDSELGAEGVEPKYGSSYERVKYPAVAVDAGPVGAAVYLDAAKDAVTVIASSHNRAGRLAKAKQQGETEAEIYLNMP